MKALSFKIEGKPSYGALIENTVHEATVDFRQRFPDLRAVLTANAISELADNLATDSPPADSIAFLPTIPNPDKLICVGVNYRPHAEEMGREAPAQPLVFVRFPGSQVGHEQSILGSALSDQYDFEGELAVVIGRAGRHIPHSEAMGHIAGYTCFMDGTMRDWQRHTSQFTAGKNFSKSGAMGPWLLTADQLPHPRELELTTRVNGAVMQEGRLSELIFDIPALIEYCSAFAELLPGDVIATGTPSGVGAGRKPPVWLQPGDCIEVDIGPVGCLRNRVATS